MEHGPSVIGPITEGQRAGPWSAPAFDLPERGYVMEEFFLDGTASAYSLVDAGRYDRSGRWEARPSQAARYRTRFLVVRPASGVGFNGTVIVTWLNVTAGFESDTITHDELLSGYAWVGVSAQKVGIDGLSEIQSPRQPPGDPLKRWDPERYGTLDHPGDAYSFDLFAQVGKTLRRVHEGSPDPLGGLAVERLIATGGSQSAIRLTTYLNAIHPLDPVFDGFFLTITPGWATRLEDASMFDTLIRDDVAEPVMVLNSEWEAEPMYKLRRDDSDHFRLWEVAGAPHGVGTAGLLPPPAYGHLFNPLSLEPLRAAAIRRMHEWLAHGTPPSTFPRIEFDSAEPLVIARDKLGNARGGLRLPEMEAPLAEYHGRDDEAPGLLPGLRGWSRPLESDELRRLYSSSEEYRTRYRRAVSALEAAGALLSPDAADMAKRVEQTVLDLD